MAIRHRIDAQRLRGLLQQLLASPWGKTSSPLRWLRDVVPIVGELLNREALLADLAEAIGMALPPPELLQETARLEGDSLVVDASLPRYPIDPQPLLEFLQRYKMPGDQRLWLELLLGLTLQAPLLQAPNITFPPGLSLPPGHFVGLHPNPLERPLWLQLLFIVPLPSPEGPRAEVCYLPLQGRLPKAQLLALLRNVARQPFQRLWGSLLKQADDPFAYPIVQATLWEQADISQALQPLPLAVPPFPLLRPLQFATAWLPREEWRGRRRDWVLRRLLERLLEGMDEALIGPGRPTDPELAVRLWARHYWDGVSLRKLAEEEKTQPETVRNLLKRLRQRPT